MYQNLDELFQNLKSNPSESFESETIEFKNFTNESALHNSKELAEEISALANLKGGKIIIGIKDSSDVPYGEWEKQLNGFIKIDLDTIKERIKGKIKPNIEIRLWYEEFEGKNYLIVDIPNRIDTIVSTTSGKTCIRDGKSSRPASPEEIQDLVKSLQFYDWSSEDLNISIDEALNKDSIDESLADYCKRRNLQNNEITIPNYLEAIGVTKNGILNKGGLIFLGKTSEIKKHLGNYEFRFSWKTKNGELKINDVWSDNIWNSVKISKKHFKSCNNPLTLKYENENKLKKVSENPWQAIEKSIKDLNVQSFVEYKGTKHGVFICVKDGYKDLFDVKKSIKKSSTNDKHIKLYKFLKEYGSGSNEEISNYLGFKYASQTSVFLRKTEFVKKGKATNSKWALK